MTTKTDEELVVEIKQGNILAYEEIVARYQKRLYGLVSKLTQDPADVAEIVQDSLFAIYKNIDKIDAKKSFSTYVLTVARNTTVSYWRKMKKTFSLNEEEVGKDDLWKELENKEEAQRVQVAIGKLDEKKRRAVRHFFFDNLSYEEISKIMAVPVNTVRTYLHRAKSILRKELKNE